MECKVIQEFQGEIEGIKINNSEIYNSSKFLLENLEEKFGTLDSKFISDFISTIETMYLKYDDFSFLDLENSFIDCINEADKFNDLEFNYFGGTWKIDNLNEKIKNNEYSKEKEKSTPWNIKKDKDLER